MTFCSLVPPPMLPAAASCGGMSLAPLAVPMVRTTPEPALEGSVALSARGPGPKVESGEVSVKRVRRRSF